MLEIKLLENSEEEEYNTFLDNSTESMFFHSIPYRNLLKEFLECEPYFLIARKKDVIIGALPSFLKTNTSYGNILNSLPFFGSNGGFIIDSQLEDIEKGEIKKELLAKFNELANENDCVLSTIITSPFDKDLGFYENNISYRYKDSRTGQIAVFEDPTEDLEEYIMYNIIEKRCRAAIRRPIKQGVTVELLDDFKPLFEMHTENLTSKGGISKPLSFFEAVKKNLGGNFNLMYAIKDDKIIAGLLLFYFKNSVEYFTPAFYIEHAVEQGMSLLMYEGMKKAIADGYKYWNFGGTWASQEGVYKFKKSWGGKDFPYYYYITQHGNIDKIMESTPEKLIEEYKWFYVLPFSELRN